MYHSRMKAHATNLVFAYGSHVLIGIILDRERILNSE